MVCFSSLKKNWSTWYLYVLILTILLSVQLSSVQAAHLQIYIYKSAIKLTSSHSLRHSLHSCIPFQWGLVLDSVVINCSYSVRPPGRNQQNPHSHSDQIDYEKGWQTEAKISSLLGIKDKVSDEAFSVEPGESTKEGRNWAGLPTSHRSARPGQASS